MRACKDSTRVEPALSQAIGWAEGFRAKILKSFQDALQPICDFQLISNPISGDAPALMSSLKPTSIDEHSPVLIEPPNIRITALPRNSRSVSL